MSEGFKEAAPVPTLVFEVPEEKPETEQPPAPVKEAAPEPVMDDSILSDQERKMVDEFSKQIDLRNSNAILQYGVGTQKKLADFSEAALENVKTQDLGEVGEMLSGLVTDLKEFDAEEDRGFFGNLFKKSTDKVAMMKARYDKAEVNVSKVCSALEAHQIQLLKDVAMLDKMY